MRLRGPLATLASLAALEVLFRLGGQPPSTVPIYLAVDLAVVYASLSSGFLPGVASAAIAALYAALAFSDQGHPFHYTRDNALRFGALALTAPGIAVMVELLRRREEEEARSRMEEQVRQSQKMEAVGRLAGGVAHDFNNLLTVILSHASFLARDPGLSEAMRQDLAQIRTAAQRAAALTKQLLVVSRREMARPVPMSLNRAVEDMAKLLGSTLGEHVELDLVLGRDLRPILADPGQIEQVLINLAVNARDAMPQGGRFSVETTNAGGGRVRLVVSETGEGMPPEVAARAFEPFFTTKPKGKGTGLGLAAVYGIVTQAKGSVTLRTEPGKGSAFTILWPETDLQPEEPEAAPPAAPPSGKGETVLVVEDEDAVRSIAVRILSRSGYAVLESRAPAEALSLLESRKDPVHLLLSDVVMPEMSGAELAEEARGIRPSLRVLFMSGYTAEALPAGSAGSVVAKPFTEETLLARVREALA